MEQFYTNQWNCVMDVLRLFFLKFVNIYMCNSILCIFLGGRGRVCGGLYHLIYITVIVHIFVLNSSTHYKLLNETCF